MANNRQTSLQILVLLLACLLTQSCDREQPGHDWSYLDLYGYHAYTIHDITGNQVGTLTFELKKDKEDRVEDGVFYPFAMGNMHLNIVDQNGKTFKERECLYKTLRHNIAENLTYLERSPVSAMFSNNMQTGTLRGPNDHPMWKGQQFFTLYQLKPSRDRRESAQQQALSSKNSKQPAAVTEKIQPVQATVP